MDTLTESFPNPTNVAALLAFAVQSTLIIFFVVSPAMGFLLARSIKTRVNFVIAWGLGVLVVLAGIFGVSLLLRRVISPELLSDPVLTLLCGLGSVAAGILVARYIGFVLSEPGKPQWAIEQENIPDEELLPIERQRKREMTRKQRSRK